MTYPGDLKFCQILDTWIPQLPKAKDAIQIIIQELKQGSITSWGNIRILLYELYKHKFQAVADFNLSSRKKFAEFTISVITLFNAYKCSDIYVIADALELLCITSCLSYFAPKELGERYRSDDKNPIPYTSIFEMILVCSYKEIQSFLPTKEAISFTLCRIWIKVLANSTVHILKLLISIGATLIVPQNMEFEHKDVACTLSLLLDIETCLTEEDRKSFPLRISQNLESQFNERSRKRIFFINMFLTVLPSHDFHKATDEYIQCVRILTMSTPEPLITSEEIKSYITKLCGEFNLNEKVQQFLEKYEFYFPESREALTPRSLQHLCRFQARENLRTARSFPHGVESLVIPTKLKNYICFKDII